MKAVTTMAMAAAISVCVAACGGTPGPTEGAGGNDSDGSGGMQASDDRCGAIGSWRVIEPPQSVCGVDTTENDATVEITADDVARGSWSETTSSGDTDWVLDEATCIVTVTVAAVSSDGSQCLVGTTTTLDLRHGTCQDQLVTYQGDVCVCTGPLAGCTITKG